MLDEIPPGIAEAEVLVIFAPAEAASEKRAEAIQRMVQQMREGFPIGGKGYTQREELYAERLDRYGNSNG
ncbi:MAG: hypothetical protein N2554_07980 [Fimbriimonadales bacterium]|nr:hypothetical protein [Fimbriimonadales bacterium]